MRGVLVFLLLSLVASPALAWTDATVLGANARVDVAPDASALVSLTVRVRVHGGWLEQLELAGLDPDLELDAASPPTATTEDGGTTYAPTAQTRDGGRVVLRFGTRRDAPRRGTLLVSLRYRTLLAHRATLHTGDDRLRVRWTLPAWQAGLDGVTLEMHTPPGGLPADNDVEAGIERSVEEDATGTLVRWRRPHLPRTTPWTIAVDVPDAQMEASLARPRVAVVQAAPSQPARPPSRGPLWLCVALAVLAFAQLVRARRAAAWVVPMPSLLVRAPVLAGLALAAQACLASNAEAGVALLVALVACALPRVALAPSAPRLGAWRAVTREDLRRARWDALFAQLGPRAWLDLTTLGGVSVFAACVAAAVLALPEAGALAWLLPALALPLFVTATRLHAPPSAHDGLRRLRRVAARLRGPFALHLELYGDRDLDTRRSPDEARLCVVRDGLVEGLLRVDLAYTSRPRGGVHERELVLLLVAREGTDAAFALARMTEGEPVRARSGRKLARLLAAESDLGAQLTRVLESLAAPSSQELQRAA